MDPQQPPPQQVNHDATMINSFGLPMSFGKQKNFNHNNYAANHNSGAMMMENVQQQQQQHHYQQHHQNVQHRGNYNNNNNYYNHRGNRQKREYHQHSSHQHQHQQQHNYNNKRPRFNNHHSTSQNHHQNQRSQKYKSKSDDHFDVTQYFKPSFLQDPWQPRVSHTAAAVFSPPTIVDPSMQEEVKRVDETGTTSTSQETVLVDTANNGVVDVVTSNEEIMNPECIDI